MLERNALVIMDRQKCLLSSSTDNISVMFHDKMGMGILTLVPWSPDLQFHKYRIRWTGRAKFPLGVNMLVNAIEWHCNLHPEFIG